MELNEFMRETHLSRIISDWECASPRVRASIVTSEDLKLNDGYNASTKSSHLQIEPRWSLHRREPQLPEKVGTFPYLSNKWFCTLPCWITTAQHTQSYWLSPPMRKPRAFENRIISVPFMRKTNIWVEIIKFSSTIQAIFATRCAF